MFVQKNNSYFILVAFFLALLVLPNMVMLFNTDDVKPFPKFDKKETEKSIAAYENHYLKNFGLKSSFIDGYVNFKNNILNENPIPDRVVKGKNDWFFLGNFYKNVLDESFGLKPFTNTELKKLTVKLQELQKYFNSKGIVFYVVIPPNKHNLYKENLPFQLKQKATNLEQLIRILPKDLKSSIIDLSPALESFKSKQQLYISTDSHWNGYGSFVAYCAVIDSINKNINVKKTTIADYNTIENNSYVGDLMNLIKLPKNTTDIKLSKKVNTNITLVEKKNSIARYKNDSIKNQLKIIMYHDSFTYSWQKYFNESFEESIYKTNYKIHKKFIEKEKPDVVIIEIIERNLDILSQVKLF